MNSFTESICKHFDFLTRDYGFIRSNATPKVLPELGDSDDRVRYEGPHIFIWIGAGKGELDVVIFAKVHTTILRPAARRSFDLDKILLHVAPESLKSFPSTEMRGWIPDNYDAILQFYAEALRKHCDYLLRMDMKLLEEVCSKN
ncbi:MAG: hypothetical protein ABI042_08905 [Verrucomicrobiota bacterium]